MLPGMTRETVETYQEDSINLLDLLVRLVSKWRTFLVTCLISVVVGAFMVYRIKPLYEANVSILPSTPSEDATSLSALFSGRHSNDVYVALLRSRAVLDNVIHRLDLQKVYNTSSLGIARGTLAQKTKVLSGADPFIVVVVRDADAALATRIANAYLEALDEQQIAMASSSSGLRRAFFAKQLQQEKDALANAEEDLRKTQESLGIVQVQQQTSIGISAIADIRAQITAAQVRLSSLLLSETEQNPEVRAVRTQIAQLQAQERTLSAGKAGDTFGAAMPAGRMPAANLAYARKEREVQYHTALFNSLAHDLENARLSEAAAGQTFQVVDRAVEPEFRAWPDRKMLMLLTLAVSLLLGFVAVFIHLLVDKIGSDPENRRYLREMRSQFQIRR